MRHQINFSATSWLILSDRLSCLPEDALILSTTSKINNDNVIILRSTRRPPCIEINIEDAAN